MQDAAPSAITYQAKLPLAWTAPAAPDSATLALWHHGNLALLHALATLEAAAPPDSERESDHAYSKTLDRIEAKLDLSLTLLARLIGQQAILPPQRAVTLAAEGLSWSCPPDEAPADGSDVLIALYLSPRLPEPLHLWSRVACRTGADHDRSSHCHAAFLDKEAEMEEWMTRTLFRYHRRALQARRQEP